VIAAAELAEDEALDEASDVIAAAGEVENEAIAEAAIAVAEADQVEFEAGMVEEAAIEEAEATVELAARIEDAAGVTAAEKRLLRYLNTGLTFAMIADKLHISRGAVKDRASRLYKKLGVHNREDAAEAAIELGLIKG
jgi:DNA-binding NarL/FixJ family response regulator